MDHDDHGDDMPCYYEYLIGKYGRFETTLSVFFSLSISTFPTWSVDELATGKACANWGEGKADYVFDVLTTGDLEMAAVGAF